jgi:hypothetical protein
MSQNFSAGQLVRISPEVIPETAKDDELLGELGVPGLLRHAIFEIIEVSTDQTRGPIALCRITNPEVFKQVIPGIKEVKSEGELVLLLKEIVPSNMKITLDYVIEGGKSREQMLVELFDQRKVLKGRGMDKRNKRLLDLCQQAWVIFLFIFLSISFVSRLNQKICRELTKSLLRNFKDF